MRKTTPRVIPYHRSATSKLKFAVVGLPRKDDPTDPTGKRKKRHRLFFKTRRAADKCVRDTVKILTAQGEADFHIDPQLRRDAIECDKKLRKMGKGIVEATNHFLAHLASIERSCTVSVLIKEFLAAKASDGASERYLKDLRNRLAHFDEAFGGRMVATMQTNELDNWLRELKLGGQSRNNYRTILRTLFKYAKVQRYSPENVGAFTAKAKVVRGAPEIFTPEQMRTILGKAPADFVPYLAIGAFAGLRAAEIERLDWSEIKLSTKLIEVKAEKAKGARRRNVKISDNLTAWLAPHVRASGAVADSERVIVARRATCAAAGIKWPANALRHSYASYHVAHFQNAPATSAELGHTSPAMLYEHYREVVTPDSAAQWWQITPPADYGNVVAFESKQA